MDGPAEHWVPPPPELPIVPLGRLDGRYFFFDPLGELREIGEARLGAFSAQLDLFAGNPDYLTATWPRFNSERQLVGFHREKACAGLMAMCAKAGLWDPETPIRGRGVWLAETKPVAHSGDRLHFAGGRVERAGLRIGAAVFPRKPASAAPAEQSASAQDVRAWKADFRWWRFAPLGLGGAASEDRGADGLGADLLFSAVSLAMLGAAPRWRVHALVKAPPGAGKSTLIEFGAGALGGQALVMNNFSEAAFRQTLANEARAVWLDEAEGGDDERTGSTMAKVIHVIRQMSGGSGVKGARGGADGTAQHFEIAGCAFLACVNPPPLLPADLSRILVLTLLPGLPEHEARAKEAVDRAADLSTALRRRALEGWARFQANLALSRAALIARGCSSRQADVLGGLLAAGAMMEDDMPIDAGGADDLAESVVPLIEAMRAEEADGSDAQRCWRLLLSQRVDVWRGGEMQTVGSLLATAQGEAEVETRRLLDEICGLRLQQTPGHASMPEAPCLYVVRQHAFLRSAFRDTPWREGGWANSLSQLGGAVGSRHPVRVARIKQRCVAVPLDHLPERRNRPPPSSGPPPDPGH